MTFRGIMFDKESGEVFLIGLEHSVTGDNDKHNVNNGGEEEAGMDLDGEAASVKAAAMKTSKR